MAFFPITNTIGTDLNNSTPVAVMPTNSSGGVLPPHKPGTRIIANGDSEWVYAQAAGAISAYDCVTITTSGTAQRATPANVAAGQEVAFAQNAFADTDYGWFARNGNPLTVNVSSTTAVNLGLYIGASGKLTYVTSSGTVMGVGITYASTLATVQAVPAFVSWPRNPAANG